jgi:enoyl-CoA hydratase
MAIAAAKQAIDGGLDTDLANGLKLESHVFAALFATDDQEAGMRSFLANGPGKAVFTGK